MNPETQPIVGEDGELIKPDTAVKPDEYAYFVATNVRRDPLLFRIREHVSYYGCAYLCLLPVLFLVLVATINGAGACAIASLAVVLIAFAMGAKDI